METQLSAAWQSIKYSQSELAFIKIKQNFYTL